MSTNEFRRRRKTALVKSFGGKCQICLYDKCDTALEFHHLNSSEKEFTLSKHNRFWNLDKICHEAKKSVLLCANCHREIHAGLITSPPESSFNELHFRSFFNRTKPEKTCLTCGIKHTNKNYCSVKCASKNKVVWDDEVLVSLRAQGKSNVYIGNHFGVSDVAVIKRLKKLNIYK